MTGYTGPAPASARAVPPLVSYPPKVTTLVWPPSHLGFGGATKCGTCLAVAGGSTAAGVRGIGDHMYCMYNTVYGVLYFSFHSVGTRALGATRHFGRLFLLFTIQTLLPLHLQNTHTSLQASNLSCILLLSSSRSCCRPFGPCCRPFSPSVQPLLSPVWPLLSPVWLLLSLIWLLLSPVWPLLSPVWLLLSLVWPLFRSPLGSPAWQTIYNTLSSSSFCEWTVRTTITHGITYRCLEACCLSTLEALLSVWQDMFLPILSGFGSANKGRRYQT